MVFLAAALALGAGRGTEKGFYLEVPFVYQVRNYCGPAVAAMVLRYWSREASQHELADRIQPFPDRGLTGVQLKELAEENGLLAHSFKGDADFVRSQLRKGRPIIVALAPPALSAFNHYVVLVGWDNQDREWIAHDPFSGPFQRLSARHFEKRWSKLGHWTLLLTPKSGG